MDRIGELVARVRALEQAQAAVRRALFDEVISYLRREVRARRLSGASAAHISVSVAMEIKAAGLDDALWRRLEEEAHERGAAAGRGPPGR
jgi:hypothetical protein